MKKVSAALAIAFLILSFDAEAQLKIYPDNNQYPTFIKNNTPEFLVRKITLSTGVQLEYEEQGDPNGIPVIMLHGFTDSWQSFAPVLPYLPASLHVFALSQRGHGNSSKKATSYQPEDFAEDVAAFIKEKRLGPAVIVGHSMGSTNAQCFASHYPGLTRALILVASFAGFDKPMIHEFKKVIDGLNDPVDSLFIVEFQKSTVTRPVSAERFQAIVDESLKVPAHVWKGVAAGWASADYVRALQNFDKPTLIIWGDKDAYCPKDDQLLLNSALGNSTLLVYEGTGHANHWEEPERFANDLIEFVLTLNSNKEW
jgi:pimeloyl-ACP methyl ester carboxylesterase